MGQEVSVSCPVCKTKKAVYKDKFEAECLNYKDYSRWVNKLPEFSEVLGKDCMKYIDNKLGEYDQKEHIVYWLFYSCEDCINIGDKQRREKFQEHNQDGITRWYSQLP